jgi:hypothetical protein
MEKENATSPEKKAALESIRLQFNGTSTAAQCDRLRDALGRFALNSFEAMRYLDVYHCPARVLQLRKQGYRIATHRQTVITEAGERHRVGLYMLEGQPCAL